MLIQFDSQIRNNTDSILLKRAEYSNILSSIFELIRFDEKFYFTYTVHRNPFSHGTSIQQRSTTLRTLCFHLNYMRPIRMNRHSNRNLDRQGRFRIDHFIQLSTIIYNIYKLLIKRSLLLLSFHFLLFLPSFSKIGKDEETRFFRFRLCTFSRSRRFLSSSRFIGFWRRRWFVDLWRRGAWLFGKVWIQLPFRTIYMDLYPYNAPIIFTSACLFIVGNFGNGG